MSIMGRQVRRVDAYGKVTGEAKCTADLEPRDILRGKVVYSTITNGLVKNIDLTEAYQVPGVVKTITCFDVPNCQFPTAGHPWSVEKKHQDICDRKILNQRVRLYGDDIVAVIAEGKVAAVRAAHLVKVGYEEYTPIITVEAAMAGDATPPHPDLRKDNVIVHSHVTTGDSDFTYEDGLKEAGSYYEPQEIVFLEREYNTPRISHCRIELPVSWAYVDTDGKIAVVSSTQIPHIVRRCTAQALGIPIGRVHVIEPYIGSDFDNKQDVPYEPLNAFLTMSVGERPVRLEISREETISDTRTRHAIKGKYKGLVTKDGRVLAKKLDAYANSGAYASHNHVICANYGNVSKDLYRDELDTEVDCFTIYTSSPTAGTMRTHGILQAAWFARCLADDLADTIGMDPYEFRLKNCMEDGSVGPAGSITSHSYGLKKCIEEGRKHIRWDEKWNSYRNQTGPARRGVGMVILCYKTGVHPISLETASARMILSQDGSVQLCMGATEIGQGADAVFAQMASQTTGTASDKVYIVSAQDTDVAPFDTGVYASHQTYMSGMACEKCGEEFRPKILGYAAYMLSHDVNDLSETVYADGVKAAATLLRETLGLGEGELVSAGMLDIENNKIVVNRGDPMLFDLSTVADTAFYSLDRSIHITAEVTDQYKNNTFSSSCYFMEIEVDIPLGLITVKDIINVHDSGVLISPMIAWAQVHGDMSMGLRYALSEELLVNERTGRPLSNNLLDYKIPTAMDTPDLNVAFIELEDPTGSYGSKSLGESPTIPAVPVIRDAILNATGVHMGVTPMTAQWLIEKFKEKGLI